MTPRFLDFLFALFKSNIYARRPTPWLCQGLFTGAKEVQLVVDALSSVGR
jgi:hypothetical protein